MFHTPSVACTLVMSNCKHKLYLQYTVMMCCCVLSFVHNMCLPVHEQFCPLLSSEVTSSTLEMAYIVDGLPAGVDWVAPSHDHVIVATGFYGLTLSKCKRLK
jgi:hypothetical protein